MSAPDQLITQTRTDWHRLQTQTDADIAAAVQADPDAAPIPTAEELRRFEPAPARNRS